MAKTDQLLPKLLIPNNVVLTDARLEQLQQEYVLGTRPHIQNLKEWRSPGSKIKGVIICPFGSRRRCFPYYESNKQFLKDFEGGKIFE